MFGFNSRKQPKRPAAIETLILAIGHLAQPVGTDVAALLHARLAGAGDGGLSDDAIAAVCPRIPARPFLALAELVAVGTVERSGGGRWRMTAEVLERHRQEEGRRAEQRTREIEAQARRHAERARQDAVDALTAEERRYGPAIIRAAHILNVEPDAFVERWGRWLLGPNGKTEVDHEALRAAPPGAIMYRETKRGWSIEANNGAAAVLLLNYYMRTRRTP